MMYRSTCLITARAGSSYKDKCLRPILGKSCLERAIQAALRSSLFDQFYVSTNCDKISQICISNGFIHIDRPSELSSDNAAHVDVINHALNNFKSIPESLCVVLPNNPFISANLLIRSADLLASDPSVTSVIPVYQDNDHHPLRSKVIDSQGLLRSYGSYHGIVTSESLSTNRQSLQPSYFPAHNFWLLNVRYLDAQENKLSLVEDGEPPWSFFGVKSLPIAMPFSHDIHAEVDISICENLLKFYDEH
jgi:CMP-N-acetylneuraminic acid synthetase